MVIISKDDYLSFLNEVGVRMQTPPVNVNSQLSTVSSTTSVNTKRSSNDSNKSQQISVVPQLQPPLPQAQTHLQQLQQQATLVQNQQLNTTNGSGNNKAKQVARAILMCRPNSHPFQVRYFIISKNKKILNDFRFTESHIISRTKCTGSSRSFSCTQ